MINYIKAELYRNFNRPYLWIYSLIIAAIPLMIIILCKINYLSSVNLAALLKFSLSVLIIPIYLVIGMIDMISCEEYKNGTLKNVLSFGVPRGKLIVSKFVAAVILAFMSAFIVLIVLCGSGAILLGVGSNISSVFLDTFMRIGAAVPLWIAAIAIGIFFNMLITNSNVFSFVYIGIFLIMPQGFKLLSIFVSDKFKYLYDIFPTTQLSNLGKLKIASGQINEAIALGCLYTVVFLILSIICFKNKEIK